MSEKWPEIRSSGDVLEYRYGNDSDSPFSEKPDGLTGAEKQKNLANTPETLEQRESRDSLARRTDSARIFWMLPDDRLFIEKSKTNPEDQFESPRTLVFREAAWETLNGLRSSKNLVSNPEISKELDALEEKLDTDISALQKDHYAKVLAAQPLKKGDAERFRKEYLNDLVALQEKFITDAKRLNGMINGPDGEKDDQNRMADKKLAEDYQKNLRIAGASKQKMLEFAATVAAANKFAGDIASEFPWEKAKNSEGSEGSGASLGSPERLAKN